MNPHKPRKQRSERKSPTNAKYYEGKLSCTKSGVGYVLVPDLTKDILIPQPFLSNAFHGDIVKVQVLSTDKTGKLRGKITRIVKRLQTEFIARISRTQNGYTATITNPYQRVTLPLIISETETSTLQKKAMIAIREVGKKKLLEGTIIRFFTPDEAETATLSEILLEKHFSLEFSAETLLEAEKIKSTFDKQNTQRADFTDRFTCTIDPDDAKDFDDALSLKTLNDTTLEIGIHIADVSHFVLPHTALDTTAYNRATSVYLPGRVLPMLPEKISNYWCSLMPHTDRLAFAVIIHIHKETAEILDYYCTKTRIHSKHRYTYEEAQKILTAKKGKHSEALLQLYHISKRLRAQRIAKGAINFTSSESKFILDKHGVPIEVVIKESTDAHHLIEEFMLLANRLVAYTIASYNKKNAPILFPYRVHDTPDKEKLQAFSNFVRKLGYPFQDKSPEKIAQSYNHLLSASEGKPEAFIFDRLGIRAMAKAVYSTENIGHYGLAFPYYCHFTSPIRRYPDILVHRALMQILHPQASKEKRPDPTFVQEQARHCSERERAAVECERSANKYKQAQFLANYIGETFEGIISGVSANGFWVETLAHKCEGMVSIRTLWEKDDFSFIPDEFALVGIRTKIRYQMGQLIKIKVDKCDMEKKEIDFIVTP